MRLLWLVWGCASPESTEPTSDKFRVALLTDPHVIASDYACCENGDLDTESIYLASDRLRTAQDKLAAIRPQPELALLAGDIFHQNYKHPRVEDYLDRETAAGNAAGLLERFVMPAWPAWGNHDYESPEFSREFSHELFEALFGLEPYYAVVHRGWKFILANSQLGPTWDPLDALYNDGLGSFGPEQLAWLDQELAEGLPTFLVFHHPTFVIKDDESAGPDPDLDALIERHHDTIQAIFVGHTHRWIDLSHVYDLPHVVLGATRYDEDNFWVAELTEGTSDWSLLDEGKAVWNSVEGRAFDYDVMAVAE